MLKDGPILYSDVSRKKNEEINGNIYRAKIIIKKEGENLKLPLLLSFVNMCDKWCICYVCVCVCVCAERVDGAIIFFSKIFLKKVCIMARATIRNYYTLLCCFILFLRCFQCIAVDRASQSVNS